MKRHTQQEVSQQRLTEWEKIDEDGYRYHKTQWETPKQSTIPFEHFASKNISKSKNIIDMGAGASTALLANNFKAVHFTAFDYSTALTLLGSKMAIDKGIQNLSFEQGDCGNFQSN